MDELANIAFKKSDRRNPYMAPTRKCLICDKHENEEAAYINEGLAWLCPDCKRNLQKIMEARKDRFLITEAGEIKPVFVMCKDCENWDTEWDPETKAGSHFCPNVGFVTDPDWFCADACKKEDST